MRMQVTAGAGHTHRVVRGGSFNNNARNARAAARINNLNDNDNNGFRVCVYTSPFRP